VTPSLLRLGMSMWADGVQTGWQTAVGRQAAADWTKVVLESFKAPPSAIIPSSNLWMQHSSCSTIVVAPNLYHMLRETPGVGLRTPAPTSGS
jgi:hypothetical protein